jgi:hypothetical protein
MNYGFITYLLKTKNITYLMLALVCAIAPIRSWATTPGVNMQMNTGNLGMMSMGTGTVTVTATPVGGVTVATDGTGSSGAVISGLPAGFTASWSAPTVSSNVVTWTVSLKGGVNAVASNGTVTLGVQVTDVNSGIVYSANRGLSLAVTFSSPTLTFSPALSTVPVLQGASATDVFTFTGGGSYNGPVSLAIAGLPSGVTASWNNSTVNLVSNSGSATLTLVAAPSAAVNYFNYTVTATGDGLTVTKTSTVHVVQAPNMTIGLSTSNLSMTSMGSGTITVTATAYGGLSVPSNGAGASSAIVSGLPNGVTAAWSQPAVSSGVATWTVTLTGSANAVASSGALILSAQLTDANTGLVYSASQGLTLGVTLTSATLTFVPSVTTVSVAQGGSGTDSYTFTGGGSYHGPVTLAVSGLPSGVTASWSSSTVNLVSNSGSSTLTLAVTTAAQVASTTFTVTATGDGLTISKNYTVKVLQASGMTIGLNTGTLGMNSMGSSTATVTATATGGLVIPSNGAGASATVVSGLPTGFTASWSQPTISSSTVSWTVTLQGGVNAVASSGTVTLSAQLTDANTGVVYSASKGLTLTVSLTSPTLALAAAQSAVPVIQTGSATDTFTLTGGGSYQGAVALAVSGLPSGMTSSWSSNPVNLTSNSGSSILTLTAGASTLINWFTYTVTATGDGLTVSRNYTVQVGPLKGLQMMVSQPVLPIQTSGTATLLVTDDPMNTIAVPPGAAGSSVTIVSGLPSGVTASWSQPTVASNGNVNWNLTLSASSSAVAGSYPMNLSSQVTDASRGLVYTATQSFTVLTSLLANLSIGTTPGQTIPATFMGLSHEWDALYMIDKAGTGISPIYRQMLTNLSSYGSGPMNVRIGGASTDSSGEPTSTTVRPFAEVAKAMGVKFELGVNLGSDNVSLATDQAAAFASQMPSGSLAAIEIGNESDFYDNNGLRPSPYTVQENLADFTTWEQSITPVIPAGLKFMLPSWGEPLLLASNIQSVLSQNPSQLGIVSLHYYATDAGLNPAPDVLLTSAAATTAPSEIAGAVVAAHQAGVPFRMGEMGPADDGGIQGISDSFSAALWGIDFMFQLANEGVDGVNWQTSDANFSAPFYGQIGGTTSAPTYTLTFVHPLYYGLLLFQAASAHGTQLLPVTVSTSSNLTAWATVDASGTPRLVIINKDETATGTVEVTEPGFNTASVLRLEAPTYSSSTGVTFAGQTFDGSTDGTIQGSQSIEPITGNNGVFQLPMPITSAALVIFSK